MTKTIIVKCGDENKPAAWGFVFDNREAAVIFSKATFFGKPNYRKISNTREDVMRLVDCRGCSNPGFGCSMCVKPDEFFEPDETVRLNEHFQENI